MVELDAVSGGTAFSKADGFAFAASEVSLAAAGEAETDKLFAPSTIISDPDLRRFCMPSITEESPFCCLSLLSLTPSIPFASDLDCSFSPSLMMMVEVKLRVELERFEKVDRLEEDVRKSARRAKIIRGMDRYMIEPLSFSIMID